MTQQIINYDEEMVGANHPTKSDTLNRAFRIEHEEDGTHSPSAKPQTVDNATASLQSTPGSTATTWTAVDLSTYVPAGANWALVRLYITTSIVGSNYLAVSKYGNTNWASGVQMYMTSGAGAEGGSDMAWVEVDSNRYIQYMASNSGVTAWVYVVGYM